MRLASSVPIFAALTVAGCAPEADFPSLAVRPAERNLSIEEPVHAATAVPDDADLRRRIAGLHAEAVDGERAFDAAFDAAAAAAGASGARESESWVAAQQALSRLEASRGPTMRALAELDRLALDRAGVPTSAADVAALDAAVAAVQEIARGQQQRLDRLRERLSGS